MTITWRGFGTPIEELHWEMKSPSDDCPFRRDAPAHVGIASAIPGYFNNFQKGDFSHSCHKTDPAAEGYVRGNETVQHCAGALMFLVRADLPLQKPCFNALNDKKFELDDLVARAHQADEVFDSVAELLDYYHRILREHAERERRDPKVCCVFPESYDAPPTMLRLREPQREGYDILECRTCGKPASHYDTHWPYHMEMNFCHKHADTEFEHALDGYEAVLAEITRL